MALLEIIQARQSIRHYRVDPDNSFSDQNYFYDMRNNSDLKRSCPD